MLLRSPRCDDIKCFVISSVKNNFIKVTLKYEVDLRKENVNEESLKMSISGYNL